jgi:hypothetical protein
VPLAVKVHAETVSSVDVDVSHANPSDQLVSVAIGDERSGVRPLGQLRDVHRWSLMPTGSSRGSRVSRATDDTWGGVVARPNGAGPTGPFHRERSEARGPFVVVT